jgi:hypothetical protein
MFTNLKQFKTQLHADVPVGSDDDGRVTLHVVVPTTYIRTPDQPGERRVRDAVGELAAALQVLAEARLAGLAQAKQRPAVAGIVPLPVQAHIDRIVAILDAEGVPADAGRGRARIALRQAGVGVGNEVLRAALRVRKARASA